MRFFRIKVIPFLALLFGIAWIAQGDPALKSKIDRLVRSEPDLDSSILVFAVHSQKVLYEHQKSKLVSPASVTKLVTAGAVLDGFGPEFKFKTRLYYTGHKKNGHISGSLVVVGDGDPYFVSEKLWQLSADLKNMGIKSFGGGVSIDNSLFEQKQRDASRRGSAQSSQNAYDAPISALGVNFNTFAVALAPGEVEGEQAHVSIDPYPLDHLVIVNKLFTTLNPRQHSYRVVRDLDPKNNERLVIEGRIAHQKGLQKVYRSVGDSAIAAGETIKAFLRSEGIVINGGVSEQKLPAGAKFLFDVDSYDMQKMISGLNKYSNNFIADVLIKRLGASFPTKGLALEAGSGSMVNGMEAVRKFFKDKVGIKSPFVLENGSGLSTQNRLSAEQLVLLLRYVEARLDLFPEYLASLATGGADGTLKDRFKSGYINQYASSIRGKTGTLTQPVAVASLAGFFRHPRQGLVAFAFLENGIQGKKQPHLDRMRLRQDQILETILQQP